MKMKKGWLKRLTICGFILSFAFSTSSQNNVFHYEGNINWLQVKKIHYTDEESKLYLDFDGCIYQDAGTALPSFQKRFEISNGVNHLGVSIEVMSSEPLNEAEKALITKEYLSDSIRVNMDIVVQAKKKYAMVTFVPLFQKQGKTEKVTSFKLKVIMQEMANKTHSFKRSYTTNSILSSGVWYKIGVQKNGVFKLDYNFLQRAGLDVMNLNPKQIRIYGNGGGMLSVENNDPVIDDLHENPIKVVGEEDERFDEGDYVLFYGEGPDQWEHVGSTFIHQKHSYSDTSYYFLNVDLGLGKRINNISLESSPNVTVQSFNDFQFYEKDSKSLIKSGRRWYGEEFDIITTYDFPFNFSNIDKGADVAINIAVAGRTIGGSSVFNFLANGAALGSASIGGISDCYTCQYAIRNNVSYNYTTTSDLVTIQVDFDKGQSSALGWLDYIEMNLRRSLEFNGDQLIFRDLNSLGQGNANFHLNTGGKQVEVWEVTNPISSQLVPASVNAGFIDFTVAVDSLREFVAFDEEALYVPLSIKKIENQNLHALDFPQFVIVSHKHFLEEAEDLADFHREEDGLKVSVVELGQVFNEFSSGTPDITAIKHLMKMFYDRAGTDTSLLPKYLLLFGDASYDYKNRVSGNSNFVPAYQSIESLRPTLSYVSDDYFGLLDDNEGDASNEAIDIGIGRLPVRQKSEAADVVSKIKHYASNKTLGPWRNYVGFIGDDEDANTHMRQANDLAIKVDTVFPEYNLDKIYFDAFRQESTPGGTRYPSVNEAIDRRINQGAVVLSYVGHGGELGWAHERVLGIPQINAYTNIDKLPLFVTATCEFSRFDDPQRTAAGEYVLLNPDGGGIALLTTTRLVYSTPNFELANAFFDHSFKKTANVSPTLGDLMLAAKVNGPLNTNSRNFTLLGDPALKMAFPKYAIHTTDVPDSMKALQKVTVSGYVSGKDGNKLESFNGTVYPVVFDKLKRIETINNDGSGQFEFDIQKNVLFRGKASVKSGSFTFSFVVPKDISYNEGTGRLSFYADNGTDDGHGYYEQFVVGGADPSAAIDDDGPTIELYMNDEQFVSGGMTNENPFIYAKLFDEHGINTVGNGIGHDIVAILDNNSANAIVLNDYYESDLDSYQSGEVRYPLSQLEPGKHTLTLKAWDVYNNSNEISIDFVVTDGEELIIEHLLNYPNPFTTNTGFYFEHNYPGQALDVRIQIFTVSGKLIKTISSLETSNGFRVGPIYWDGRDDYGDALGRGVYVYNLVVTAPDGTRVDQFEKLTILF